MKWIISSASWIINVFSLSTSRFAGIIRYTLIDIEVLSKNFIDNVLVLDSRHYLSERKKEKWVRECIIHTDKHTKEIYTRS